MLITILYRAVVCSRTHNIATGWRKIFRLLGDGVHGLRQVTHVAGGDAGDGDSSVLGEVDTEVLGDLLDLGRGHTGEGEHSNLISDMCPVAGRT